MKFWKQMCKRFWNFESFLKFWKHMCKRFWNFKSFLNFWKQMCKRFWNFESFLKFWKQMCKRVSSPFSVLNTRKLLSQKPQAMMKRLSTVVTKLLLFTLIFWLKLSPKWRRCCMVVPLPPLPLPLPLPLDCSEKWIYDRWWLRNNSYAYWSWNDSQTER